MIIGQTAGEVERWRYRKDFRERKVRKKAYKLILAPYRVTAALKREEQYGLTS